MGIDVRIHVVGEVMWPEDENTLPGRMGMHVRELLHDWSHGPNDDWVPYDNVEDGIHYNSITRYYGPGYERGNWPAIHAALRLMRHMFPGAALRYGGDCDSYDDLKDVTEQFMAEMWTHYYGEHGDDYYKSFR